MIILDTNVVSETFKPRPNQSVVNWLNSQNRNDLFLTAISVAELRMGAEIMPDGKRKRDLQREIGAFLSLKFENRLLAFDIPAAEAYAGIFAMLRKMGRGISHPDCQIAAIARVQGYAIATRDVQPFLDAGLSVIDPWQEGGT